MAGSVIIREHGSSYEDHMFQIWEIHFSEEVGEEYLGGGFMYFLINLHGKLKIPLC